MDDEIPFIAVSNDQFDAMPPISDTVQCWVCGGEHPVDKDYGTDADGNATKTFLSFFKCGGETYLCGINGKEWRPQ